MSKQNKGPKRPAPPAWYEQLRRAAGELGFALAPAGEWRARTLQGLGEVFEIGTGPKVKDTPLGAFFLPAKPDALFLSFFADPEDESPFLFPVEPSVDALGQVVARYVEPGNALPDAPHGAALAAHAARLRRQTGRFRLQVPETRSVRLFIGAGGFNESMVQLENTLTLSPFVSLGGSLTQATGVEGATLSQERTRFSGSIAALERHALGLVVGDEAFPDGNNAFFTFEVEYAPVSDPRLAAFFRETYGAACGNPALPDDLPADALALLTHFTSLRDEAGLRSRLDSSEAPLERLRLAATLPDERFSDEALPLLDAELAGDGQFTPLLISIALSRFGAAVPFLQQAVEKLKGRDDELAASIQQILEQNPPA